MQQSTNHILLVRPANFGYNSETAESNTFQNIIPINNSVLRSQALKEFDQMVEKLKNARIDITLIEDTKTPLKPDAIFPNNWISCHANGQVILYPMEAQNRRTERRPQILDQIASKFEITHIHDITKNEENGRFLESTGSIIFDHNHRIAYACISSRTDEDLFFETCAFLDYQPISFQAYDQLGNQIYHTNVMMNIGIGYVVICLESIYDKTQRNIVIQTLKKSNLKIIDISLQQINSFCGNMLELKRIKQKNILAMSNTAFKALTSNQKADLSNYCELFPIRVDTIEQIGGGSVRCMILEIFLPKK